jgi:hypothetical protein
VEGPAVPRSAVPYEPMNLDNRALLDRFMTV